jgi:hypothetical protein
MMNDTQRFDRLALIAKRYRELRGLGLAVIGLAFAGASGIALAAGWDSEGAVIATLGLATVAMVPAVQWIQRYYDARFGRVKVTPRLSKSLAAGLFVTVVIGIERALQLPAHMVTPLALCGLGFLWVAIRDWPLRAYHLLGAAGVALALGVQFTADAALHPWPAVARSFLLLGLSCIAVGLLDHRLLVAALQRNPAAQSEPNQ